jgi:hypothetical protein
MLINKGEGMDAGATRVWIMISEEPWPMVMMVVYSEVFNLQTVVVIAEVVASCGWVEQSMMPCNIVNSNSNKQMHKKCIGMEK